MMILWIAAGVVVGLAARGDWDMVMGIFLGFACGGLFYDAMQRRRARQMVAAKIAADKRRLEAFWKTHTKGHS